MIVTTVTVGSHNIDGRMVYMKRTTKLEARANEALAAWGIDWTAPAADVSDAMLYIGMTEEEVDEAMRWLA